MHLDIEETIGQLGGRGLRGALVYTGTRHMSRRLNTLNLFVNGKPGWNYVISIKLEPSDAYTVYMSGVRGSNVKELDRVEDVNCDELQATVEAMYDLAMNKYNGGFIPVGA